MLLKFCCFGRLTLDDYVKYIIEHRGRGVVLSKMAMLKSWLGGRLGASETFD